MLGHIGTRDVAQGRADQDAGGVVTLRRIPGQSHASRQPICCPLQPRLIWITVRYCSSKREAGRRVPRRERSTTSPELAGAAMGIWKSRHRYDT